MLVFIGWFFKPLKHLLAEMLVYNDFMSWLTKDLLFMFASFILSNKSPECLTYKLLIVSKRRVNILAKDLTILCGTLSSLEIIKLIVISGLWVFGIQMF